MIFDLTILKRMFDGISEFATLENIFVATLVEKFIPIMPSYILFPAIGMSAHDGQALIVRCLVATLGSVGGAWGWYWLGSRVGPIRLRRLLSRYGHWVRLTPELFDRMASSYQCRPFRITVISQLVPTVRIFQALPAGMLKLPLGPFLLATSIGSLCWIAPLVTAGHVLRHSGLSARETGAWLIGGIIVTELIIILLARRKFIFQRKFY